MIMVYHHYVILSQAGMRPRFDIFCWVSGADPEARDRKHIRRIIERPMNAGTMSV